MTISYDHTDGPAVRRDTAPATASWARMQQAALAALGDADPAHLHFDQMDLTETARSSRRAAFGRMEARLRGEAVVTPEDALRADPEWRHGDREATAGTYRAMDWPDLEPVLAHAQTSEEFHAAIEGAEARRARARYTAYLARIAHDTATPAPATPSTSDRRVTR